MQIYEWRQVVGVAFSLNLTLFMWKLDTSDNSIWMFATVALYLKDLKAEFTSNTHTGLHLFACFVCKSQANRGGGKR